MKVFYTDAYLSYVMGKPVFVISEGQRCRSAWASALSDLLLCCSLPRNNKIYICYIQCVSVLHDAVIVAELTGLCHT